MQTALFILLTLSGLGIYVLIRSNSTKELSSDETVEHSTATTYILPPDEFTSRITEEFKKRDATLTIRETEAMTFEVFLNEEDEEGTIVSYVGNAYQKYLEEPGRLNEFVFKFVDAGMEGVAAARGIDADISAEQLAVVLRHQDYLDSLDKQESLWRSFHGDLIAFMVFNFPHHHTNVTRNDIEKLELSEAAAWAIAAENLKMQFSDLSIAAENQGSKYITSNSSVATGHLWLLCQPPLKSSFVAMVINKDSYMFADAGDETAVSTLASFGAHLISENDTLSDNLISCIDGIVFASSLSGNEWRPIES